MGESAADVDAALQGADEGGSKSLPQNRWLQSPPRPSLVVMKRWMESDFAFYTVKKRSFYYLHPHILVPTTIVVVRTICTGMYDNTYVGNGFVY